MMKKLCFLCVFLLSACVYRIDIQQGNILGQKDIDKLRPGLTKNQVVFVLGSPTVDDAFSDDKWTYLYTYKRANLDTTSTKRLEVYFTDDKLTALETEDYEIPEEFKDK